MSRAIPDKDIRKLRRQGDVTAKDGGRYRIKSEKQPIVPPPPIDANTEAFKAIALALQQIADNMEAFLRKQETHAR